MQSVPSTMRVALYARVSTEDQAERQTIDAQVSFLRRFAELHEHPVYDLYVDDGVSGTIPIEDRPDGRRLVEDARTGQFSSVIVYRVNRLGRTLRALLGAHDALETAGVAIKSGTEPFDTTSPVGKFVFQLLASLAELDRATTLEQMARGRDRIAADGKYTGGPIPFGYTLDAERRLVPSEAVLDKLGLTEAEYVADFFQRVAEGETTLSAESRRLTSLGVERTVRYAPNRRKGKPAAETLTAWGETSLGVIIRNPVYRGSGTVKSRYGVVERPAAALVDPSVWDAAQRTTKNNKWLSRRPGDHEYLLRGLVKCGVCGRTYCGAATGRDGRLKYRCNSLRDRAQQPEPCYAGQVDGATLERLVWDEVRRFVAQPADYLAAAQSSAREKMGDAESVEKLRRALTVELAAKDVERQRVLEMFRRGRITSDEADVELDKVAAEARTLREQLDALKTKLDLGVAQEAYLADVATLAAIRREEVEDIERSDDRVAKRRLIEGLVPEITILCERDGQTASGRKRVKASVRLRLAFGEPTTVGLGSERVIERTTACRDADCHTPFPTLVVVRSLEVARSA